MQRRCIEPIILSSVHMESLRLHMYNHYSAAWEALEAYYARGGTVMISQVSGPILRFDKEGRLKITGLAARDLTENTPKLSFDGTSLLGARSNRLGIVVFATFIIISTKLIISIPAIPPPPPTL